MSTVPTVSHGADELTLAANNLHVSGWEEITVSRGVERLPASFDVSLTERYPGELAPVVVRSGDPCKVSLGADVVIDGYIDRYAPSLDAGSHRVQIVGRSKCAALVDCSAEYPSCQIVNATVLDVAKQLAAPYGISVTALSDVGARIIQHNVSLSETPYDVIERLCRAAALLAYDGADGNLILARAGVTEAASGFTEGVNVQAASVRFSQDQRFSEYVAVRMAMDVLADVGEGGNLLGTAYDKGVQRHRRRVLIADAQGDQMLAVQRAQWEAARRFGRSGQVSITCDSWRDAAGALWTPNTLAPVHIPTLKLDGRKWLIADVSYRRGASGTTCELSLMPPEAFAPQPINLYPTLSDVYAGMASPKAYPR